ncbi:ATP-dependent zinc protease [Pseudomonas sp. C27(2019)]|uniref:retropepsin-like aspartic peptidase RloA n=1 Tax=Pseudomonas sp. C27(2019) TaxID=2604941 RepID=UPI0012461DB7|nr:ATP-dependent zinc protease [Pseudomonas sp. C27(2019)]QEY58615.1 ATP-dependent zinc protease [Pseudomonas sp. C27(2019)]
MRFNIFALLMCLVALPAMTTANEKNIYGLNEHVYIADIDMHMTAKLDTGAKTASLSARDIERFKRDGEAWVRFYLALDEAHEHAFELPIARISKIKRRSGDYDPEEDKSYTPRPVVKMAVCMGRTLKTIEVNLTDRSTFQYPFLLGSTALKKFGALVDPSLKYSVGKPQCDTQNTTIAIAE